MLPKSMRLHVVRVQCSWQTVQYNRVIDSETSAVYIHTTIVSKTIIVIIIISSSSSSSIIIIITSITAIITCQACNHHADSSSDDRLAQQLLELIRCHGSLARSPHTATCICTHNMSSSSTEPRYNVISAAAPSTQITSNSPKSF